MTAIASPATPASAPFSLKDFLSSFMLLELFKGMAVTGRYMFRRKITVQFPEEKTPASRDFGGFMPCAVMKTGKSAALPASCVRQFVQPWQSRLNQMFGKTVLGVPRATT